MIGMYHQTKRSYICSFTSCTLYCFLYIGIYFHNICTIHFYRSGGNYLLWKKNPSIYSSIYIRQVESDGITANAEWPATKLIQSTIYPDWGTAEGPWLIFRYLIYWCSRKEIKNIFVICLFCVHF